jgi:phytoene dehydrogenase-like protein
MNSESMHQIHDAYKDCYNGTFSKRPMVEMVIPSMVDPTLTPEGAEKLVCNMFVQYAPNTLANGETWTEENKNKFIKNTYDVVDEYAPNFSRSVEFQDVLFPPDLERILGMTGGNIFHGALDFNNVFFSRPMPNYSSYQSPVKGLWSCGSANHPGGGVMGAPGRNCALRLLKHGL